MWYDLGINLLSGAIELIVIYFIVDKIFEKREFNRWKPARKLILNKLNASYATLFAAARHSMKKEVSHSSPFESRLYFLRLAQHHRDKLQQTVDLNSPALDSNLMPIISSYLEISEKLFDKLKYFVEIHNPEMNRYDFVSKPPFEEMKEIEEIVNEANSNYSELIDKKSDEQANQLKEIKTIWNKLENASDRLFFTPEIYKIRENKVPYIYSNVTLQKISVNDIKHGQEIKMFKNY